MVGVCHTYSEVERKINEAGYKLISKNYKNARTKIVLEDENGFLIYSTYDNISSGKKPPIATKCNPFTTRNIMKYFSDIKSISTVISVRCDRRVLVTLRCKCGRIFEIPWYHITNRVNDVCRKCGYRNLCNSLDDVKLEYVRHGYKPLFDYYKDSRTPVPCENSDGYKGTLAYNTMISGYSFKVFSLSNPYIIYNMNLYAEKNGNGCKVITRDLGSAKRLDDVRIKIACTCGNEYDVNWSSFTSQGIFRCTRCSRKQSSYELKTEQHLNSLGVEYIEEYRFDDCRNKNTLPFDFAVIQNGSVSLLIEVDGRQHYDNYFRGYIVSQKERDEIKNNYCKDKNIPLLRIPYWMFTKSGRYKLCIENSLKQCGLINTTQE